MLDYSFFLAIAIILVSSKLFGLFSRRLHLPQVVGALIAGILIGPNCLGIVNETNFLVSVAEIGVILIMFTAGLETDLHELKKTGLSSIVVALLGVIVPLIGGYVVYAMFFNNLGQVSLIQFYENLFVGLILTATSVSITVETLREMGKLKGKVGTTILGAAIIDDIIGIILLTFLMGMKDPNVNPSGVIINIVLFFAIMGIIGFIFYKLFHHIDNKYGKTRRIPIYGVALCFFLSYVAEHTFGIADITGAYIAGIILCNIRDTEYIKEKVDIMSYMFFSPIFFSSIGIKMNMSGLTSDILLFVFVLIIVAIITKIIGCGLGAYLFKYKFKESLQIGIGMVSRGEVALIMAQKGGQAGLLNMALLPAIVLVIVVTTLISPILLKLAYRNEN